MLVTFSFCIMSVTSKNSSDLFKGTFTLRHFRVRLMTMTGKFRLPIGRLSQSTNRQSEFRVTQS